VAQKNEARHHADCRALARLPEHEIGDGPGRRKPNEETDGASSPTEACPRSAQKLTRKRRGGSSAKTRERNTAMRTRSQGGGALHERKRKCNRKKNRVSGGEKKISRPELTDATEQGNESLAAAAHFGTAFRKQKP
jgi:hypothetical protein